jgi:plastocyanin
VAGARDGPEHIFMRDARAIGAGALLVSLVFLVACGSGKPEGNVTAAAGPRVDASQAGTVTGHVTLEGQPPENASISMSSDPYCMREARGGAVHEHFVVGPDGALANVFVYVKAGLAKYAYDAPAEPVVLHQRGCRFAPRVFGIRVGQPLEIVNDDETLHNVHADASVNREFNFGQPLKGMRRQVTFDQPEVMVSFKCDVHGWMNAYAGVVDHPYFAVTGRAGRFTIPTLPAGAYVVEAWHEKLGTRTQKVTIAAKESRDLTFSFSVS